MDAVTKSVDAAVHSEGPGEFVAVLSTNRLNRDGERLQTHQWRLPLPVSIPININHSGDVSDTVTNGVRRR